ncbi:MAG: FAD-dependent oxidoreductase [Eubacteriales bacterium]|nr:FAD-dependent oxidoreductase [Eubacteriales bacterium]
MQEYDIIIIGGGPAGLTAALYARRAGKTVLLLEKATFGGQATLSPKIENYPGIAAISGNDLADKLIEQVLALGAEVELEEVVGLHTEGDEKIVISEYNKYRAKSVIIAAGAKHRRLGLPGEDNLVGEGISYCATCDGAFYAGQTVGIVGGGNSALQEAILLSEICKKVYIIQNLDYLTGECRLAELLKTKPNVEIILGTVVKSLLGNTSLNGVILKREADGSEFRLSLDGLFVAIGLAPENDVFRECARLDKTGYIISGESCVTDTPGIFAAGDCRTKTVRQITTACADGTVAAIAACNYIDRM